MTSRTTRFSAGLLALGLVLAACSDDPTPAETGEAPPTTEAETTTTEAEAEAPDEGDGADPDIVDTAAAAGGFETLLAAVEAAGLEETLRGEGPFTVFAPTDDAFAALPAGTVEGLLEEPTGDLAEILSYHVVAGEVLAADVVGLDGQEVETVNGATFTVAVGEDGTVTLTDATGNEVSVVQTDVAAGNGVIHVLDGVLLPG